MKAKAHVARRSIVGIPGLNGEVQVSKISFCVGTAAVMMDYEWNAERLIEADEAVHVFCADKKSVH